MGVITLFTHFGAEFVVAITIALTVFVIARLGGTTTPILFFTQLQALTIVWAFTRYAVTFPFAASGAPTFIIFVVTVYTTATTHAKLVSNALHHTTPSVV